MSPIFGGWLGDYHPFSIARTDDGRFLAVGEVHLALRRLSCNNPSQLMWDVLCTLHIVLVNNEYQFCAGVSCFLENFVSTTCHRFNCQHAVFPGAASGTGYVFLIEVGPGDKKEAQDTCSSAEDDGEDQHNRSYVRYRSFVFALSDQGEMANSVRFGRVGGKTRLMVGSQVGEYHFLNNVDESDQLLNKS